jgi:hypothetical protein
MTARAYNAINGTRVTNAIGVFWKLLRLPIVALLLLCEPILRVVCAGTMVLGVLAAIVLKVSAIGEHFPMVEMLVSVMGLAIVLFLYHGLIALLLK